MLLTDDDLAGESTLPVVDARCRTRASRRPAWSSENDGAQVVFPPGFTNRDNEPLPLIVRSSAGAFMYATSDLACVLDRVERLGADLLLYVVGAPQAQHLQMVFEVSKMAGWLQPPAEAVHVGFGSVLGDDRKMLRSRSGDSVKLVDLLDEAIERAAAAVAEKNPELDGDDRAAVARMIGIGAVKYADLSTDRIKDYVFDWDRMLAFEGNTGAVPPVRPCPDLFDLPAFAASSGSPCGATDRARRTTGAGARAAPAGLPDGLAERSPPTRHTSCARICSICRRTSRRSTSTAR